MKPTGILVVGRSGAKLFTRTGNEKNLHFVSKVEHPEGRLKEGALVTDRSGREFDTVNKVSHSGGHSGDAREHSDRLFLKSVAEHIHEAEKKGQFDHLYIVADPHFLGMLRPLLSLQTSKLVKGTIEKDLSTIGDNELFDLIAGSLVP